jgi:hypothetical protein
MSSAITLISGGSGSSIHGTLAVFTKGGSALPPRPGRAAEEAVLGTGVGRTMANRLAAHDSGWTAVAVRNAIFRQQVRHSDSDQSSALRFRSAQEVKTQG